MVFTQSKAFRGQTIPVLGPAFTSGGAPLLVRPGLLGRPYPTIIFLVVLKVKKCYRFLQNRFHGIISVVRSLAKSRLWVSIINHMGINKSIDTVD